MAKAGNFRTLVRTLLKEKEKDFSYYKDVIMKQFKKGDLVVMTNCYEGKQNEGKIWVCETDCFLSLDTGRNVVKLKGFDDNFLCECLQKVNVAAFLEEERYYD
jgi:hypothetical protein